MRTVSQESTPYKVSIITPCYNAAEYLPDLLRSIAGQTWKHIEHIAIDDGSTDGGETLSCLKTCPSLVWRSRPNRGQYATINEGLAMASGDLITIISADDRYASATAIECMVKDYRLHERDHDAIYGRTQYINSKGLPLTCQPPTWQPKWMLPYRFPYAHCSLFISRRFLLQNTISWNESLRYVGDAMWIMNLLQRGLRVRHNPMTVAEYRVHESQISAGLSNPRRNEEHSLFDESFGVRPIPDMIIRRSLGLRRLAIHGLTRLLGRRPVH
jgi:glycosyltransferase involved in cell wall biosynthesis